MSKVSILQVGPRFVAIVDGDIQVPLFETRNEARAFGNGVVIGTRKADKRGVIYYDRPSRSWWGFNTDKHGHQRGGAVHAASRDECLQLVLEK